MFTNSLRTIRPVSWFAWLATALVCVCTFLAQDFLSDLIVFAIVGFLGSPAFRGYEPMSWATPITASIGAASICTMIWASRLVLNA